MEISVWGFRLCFWWLVRFWFVAIAKVMGDMVGWQVVRWFKFTKHQQQWHHIVASINPAQKKRDTNDAMVMGFLVVYNYLR